MQAQATAPRVRSQPQPSVCAARHPTGSKGPPTTYECPKRRQRVDAWQGVETRSAPPSPLAARGGQGRAVQVRAFPL
eukprot:364933-Chlamydomonas_euryale.AAC.16